MLLGVSWQPRRIFFYTHFGIRLKLADSNMSSRWRCPDIGATRRLIVYTVGFLVLADRAVQDHQTLAASRIRHRVARLFRQRLPGCHSSQGGWTDTKNGVDKTFSKLSGNPRNSAGRWNWVNLDEFLVA